MIVLVIAAQCHPYYDETTNKPPHIPQSNFHWNVFLGFQLKIFHHWFRKWLVACSAPSNFLSQWCHSPSMHICLTMPQCFDCHIAGNESQGKISYASSKLHLDSRAKTFVLSIEYHHPFLGFSSSVSPELCCTCRFWRKADPQHVDLGGVLGVHAHLAGKHARSWLTAVG